MRQEVLYVLKNIIMKRSLNVLLDILEMLLHMDMFIWKKQLNRIFLLFEDYNKCKNKSSIILFSKLDLKN